MRHRRPAHRRWSVVDLVKRCPCAAARQEPSCGRFLHEAGRGSGSLVVQTWGCRTRRWDSYAVQPTQPGRGDSVDSARASRHHVSRHAKDWRDICSRDEVPVHHGYVTTPTRAVLVTLPPTHPSHSITYPDVLRALVTPVDHVSVTNTTAWNTPKAGHAAHYKGPPSAGTPASSHRPGHSCAVPFRRGGQ